MKQIKYLAILASVFLYIGCGGGGVDIKSLNLYTDANAIAYNIGTNDWKVVNQSDGANMGNGLKHYEIVKAKKLTVALRCDNGTYIVGVSNNDGDIKLKCSNLSDIKIAHTLSGNIIDETSNTNIFYLAHGTSWDLLLDNNDFSLKETNGNHDLVAMSYDDGPTRFYIERNVNIDNYDVTLYNVDITESNSCPIKNKNFTRTANFAEVFLVTKNDTYFSVQIYSKNRWFYPDCQLDKNDIYSKLAYNDTNLTAKIDSFLANSTKKDISINEISYIKPLTQISYADSGILNGLTSYIPSNKSLELQAYMIELYKGADTCWVLLSKDYIANSDSFKIPDLSSVSGFSNSYTGKNATKVIARVAMSSSNIGDMMQSGRVINFEPVTFFGTKFLMLESGTLELATQLVKDNKK